jgi:hypothetical protein
MSPAPARVLAERLAAARAQGVSFDEAWPNARKAALRSGGDGWRERLDEDKDSLWRRAFERQRLAVEGDLSLLIEGRERDTPPVLAEMPGGVLAEALA